MSETTSYGNFAFLYDTLTDDVEYEKRCDYLEKIFSKHLDFKPSLIADLGCGTGTVCTNLSDRGYDMIGIDSSEMMLGEAFKKKGERQILYLNQDMTSFELYGTVDVFLSMLDSMNYITSLEELEDVFALVKNYLNPGGIFVFDINTPYKYEQVLSDNTFTYDDKGIFYVWENSFDGEYCDFLINFFVEENGTYSRFTEEHTQRCHTFKEVLGLIEKSGLSLEGVYNDLTFDDPTGTSERIFLVLKKQEGIPINTITKETIKNPALFLGEEKMTKAILEKAIDHALKKIDKLWDDVHGNFASHAGINNIYSEEQNVAGWNTGFFTGLLWLAYEVSGNEKYKERALSHVASFYKRIDEKIGVDHHDMGFLYIPSCVAAYKTTGNELAKEAALKAADHLLTRYIEKGGYIQAWGKVGSQPRLIIDCMNNIPLLFWAAKETGDGNYFDKANNHTKATVNNIVRPDASTYHTFYFKPDGSPDYGATHQGAHDNSCWARGQAWIISGLPINYKYTQNTDIPDLFEKVTNYYLNRLPSDYIPYWDLDFSDGANEPKDSSSAAIAVCGILEMLPNIKDENLKAIYKGAADKIVYSLFENYSTKNIPESNALLIHATYALPQNVGVDEPNIWGCYYYMEALARMYKGIKGYW